MYKNKPFILSMIILSVLIALHSFGSFFSWYWSYPWFDIIVHTVSGLWAALLMLWLASCFGLLDSLKNFKIRSLLIAIISALLVGIFWELLEKFSQITSAEDDNYLWLTTKDILSDTIGGVLAYLYFIKRKKVETTAVSTFVLHPFYDQTGVIKKSN